MTSMRLPDHQQLDYDYASGQLTQLNLNGEMLTRHHHQAGREQFRQQGQLTSHYQYDDQGRLSAHTVNQRERHATDPAKTVHHQLYKRTYGYSENGNLLSLEDSSKGRRQYHYDALNRLQQVSGSLTEQLIHDPAGNLLDGRGEQSDVSKGNRLAFKGDRHYQYDEFGNLVEERRGTQQKLISRYEYDSQHRLIKADLSDGSSAQYRYDVFGRRISKTVNEKDGTRQETAFLWQGDKLVAEVDELTQQHTSYIYEPYTFKPMAMLKGSGQATEVYYYQLDHLGTPQELTDSQGKIVWSAHYRAYGQLAVAEVEDVINPIRFQGQYHDLETGLYYNRHRYYDPHTTRFTTIDPIGLAGGLNNYQYVPNPTGWIDPLGLASTPGNCPSVSYEKPEENYVYFNKTHKDSLPKPKGRGPNNGRLQSHHGLQQQWAKENLVDYGYDSNLAPSVTLETGKGLPHTTISNGQNTRRNARVEAGQEKWSSGLQDELQYIVDDMSEAGFQPQTINLVLEQQYKMLDKLNVPYKQINQ
ncbi:RHS repeat-associated core domain-containing protein [Aliamphritea ceti]|uniref:RHS repeat-associated core domain-containing protein n=1 Tax=Aliamphritea ceti TaxID=1524258 RepID=UPI00406BD7C2